MKVLPFDLSVTTTGPAKGQKLDYITPGSHSCEVTGIKTSDQLDNYKGSPFIDFLVTSNGSVGKCRFWAVKETDKQSSKDWKIKQLKDFLINCGVKDFSDDSKAMNDAIGKKLTIAFTSQEYTTIVKTTSEPVIRTSVGYRWSAKEGGRCTYNADMNQVLDPAARIEFAKTHKKWADANNTMANDSVVSMSAGSDEDMPF
tara:strand:- start:18963 stop:19562 length:600 start_codon:yes stop_codon:yes gene_type:complete